jgi:UDP-N-acetylmuramoyl-tripeptide--D-alanyl-D-alanine ligase
MEFDPSELARWTGGQWSAPPPAVIKGIHFDSRKMEPGAAFIALTEGHRDGHDFLEAASSAGASCAIVERSSLSRLPQLVVADSMKALSDIAQAQRERFRNPVIGITGSCGKTSTKGILQTLLGSARCLATPGNWNNRIGVPMTLFDLDMDKHDYAVIEAGISEPCEMETLAAMIQPDLVLVTHVGAAHLEGLGTIEGVAREKARLMERARSDARLVVPEGVYAFPEFQAFAARTCLVLEGETPVPEPAPAQVVRYQRSPKGIKLLEKEYSFSCASSGMCSNAALAIAAVLLLEANNALGIQALASWEPDPRRGACLSSGEQIFYVDCYNANPASMLDALATFEASIPLDKARAYVLGAMDELGDEAVRLHKELGQSLQLRPNDKLYLVGPPDLTSAYVTGAASAGVPAEQIIRAVSVDEIKSGIAAFAGAVFLKGSRHYTLEALLPDSLKSNTTTP